VPLTHCRLCNSADLHFDFAEGYRSRLKYYRCHNCRLVNYDLDHGLDQSQYTEVYVSPTLVENKRNVEGTATWQFLHRHVPGPAKLMDIGCGNGCILYLAREHGWEVRGLELSADAARAIAADTGIEVDVGNFLKMNLDDSANYDVVILRHVLEHLPDSVGALRQINALLRPGGYALLEFPNIDAPALKFKRAMKKLGLRSNTKYPPEWRPGHCNEFCRYSFNYLARESDFALEIWQTYSSKPTLNAIYNRLPIGTKARVLLRKNA